MCVSTAGRAACGRRLAVTDHLTVAVRLSVAGSRTTVTIFSTFSSQSLSGNGSTNAVGVGRAVVVKAGSAERGADAAIAAVATAAAFRLGVVVAGVVGGAAGRLGDGGAAAGADRVPCDTGSLSAAVLARLAAGGATFARCSFSYASISSSQLQSSAGVL
jgi:hypothetical protein